MREGIFFWAWARGEGSRRISRASDRYWAKETETRSCPGELLRLPPLPSNDFRQNLPSCVDEPALSWAPLSLPGLVFRYVLYMHCICVGKAIIAKQYDLFWFSCLWWLFPLSVLLCWALPHLETSFNQLEASFPVGWWRPSSNVHEMIFNFFWKSPFRFWISEVIFFRLLH